MALQYVGGKSNNSGGSSYSIDLTSLSGGLETSAKAGDIVVVIAGNVTGQYPTIVTPTGYTKLSNLSSSEKSGTYPIYVTISYKIMGSTPDTSITIPAGTNKYGGSSSVHVWRGVDLTNPIDVTITTASNYYSRAINSPSITPVTQGSVILSMGASMCYDITGATEPTGYSNKIYSFNGGYNYGCVSVASSKLWSGSGAEDPGAWGFTGVTDSYDTWAAVSLVLRPATLSPSNFFQLF